MTYITYITFTYSLLRSFFFLINIPMSFDNGNIQIWIIASFDSYLTKLTT